MYNDDEPQPLFHVSCRITKNLNSKSRNYTKKKTAGNRTTLKDDISPTVEESDSLESKASNTSQETSSSNPLHEIATAEDDRCDSQRVCCVDLYSY